MSAHSIWGPSQADRWLNCPGSVLATKDLPDVDTEFSIEGTAAHSLAEEAHARESVLSDVGIAFPLGIPVEKVDGGTELIEVTQEMIDGVKAFLDYCDEQMGDDYSEMRVAYEEYVPGGFGTMDRAKVSSSVANIIDFKYGKGVQVFAEENPQLMLYGLGFYLRYGWMYDIQKLVLHIAQPRLDHIDRWEISLKDLLDWAANVVKPTAFIAASPGAPFKAGEWCQFCKLKATCKTRARAVFEALTAEREDLDLAMKSPIRVINTLSNEEVDRALRIRKNATAWFKDLEKYALSQLGKCIPVGDHKVVEGKSNRVFEGDEEKIAAELVALGASREEIFVTEMISPAEAEKIVGKGGMKALAKYVKKPKGKPVLAPGSDKRPPITHDAKDEFQVYGDDDE